uniref:ADAM metallopeptidase domain 8 n=1 Tax=Saimiri boliviensis boliviensis TaxID=39432 RepID=A0A2K6UIW0_SAIBB
MAPSQPWAPLERYEVVLPQRLPGPRARRALPSHSGLYPERVSYVLAATGHSFTLHLRKNRDLLGSGYTETYTAANGSEVTEQPRGQDLCFYQGHVEGHADSAASISTCLGLRGFFQVGSDLHLIEPLDEGGEGGRHALYPAEQLLQTAGTCGVTNDTLGRLLGPRTAAVFRSRPGGPPSLRDTRYVELYVVADNAESGFPRMFSDCSQTYLESFLEQPQSACLADAPDLSLLVGGPVCGNLFVERGEQCDCGPPEECRNRCCNSTTCQLVQGAQCAHGTCCQECQVKPAGELCRPQKDTCDLEEFCDGRHPECPEDAFQENGAPCFGGYCYNGTCPTLAQRCQALWGPGGHAAKESCFFYDVSPNCRSSWNRADMCGTLQCQGGQLPAGRSSCTLNDICRALTTEGGAAYEPVPEGTRCGPEKVCWKGRCQDFHVYRSRNCSARCHNHGVCNHKQECHCHVGWAPPDCAKLLTEAHTASESLPVVLVVVLVLLAVVLVTLVGGAIYRKARSRVQSRSTAPKTTMGRSNPLFHQASSSALAKGGAPAPTRVPHEQVPTTHLGQPAGHPASSMAQKRPPPAPPAAVSSTPFPVPVYNQMAPKRVVRPTFTPPVPPVKPGAGTAKPGAAEGAVGPKVALKPPIQRKPGAGAPTVP